MSEPVSKKSYRQDWLGFFEKAFKIVPSCLEKKSLEGVFQWDTFLASTPSHQPLSWSQWFKRAGAFPKFSPGPSLYSAALKSLPFDPKYLEPFIDGARAWEYPTLFSLKEFSAFKKDSATDNLTGGLTFCLQEIQDVPPDPSKKEDIATQRLTFIQNLAVNIIEPKAMDRFIAIMEGLLGDEYDKTKWRGLYDEYFGWSPEDLAFVDETSFAYEDSQSLSLTEDARVAGIVASDPQVSGYLAGLTYRVESLYGEEDPDFVEEYKDYVELTVNTLASKNHLDLLTLQDHLRTPESYRKMGFLNLPERPDSALTGSEFMREVLGIDLKEFKKNPRQLGSLSKIERENAILEQIELGNIPDFLRRPKAVIMKGPDGGEVTTYVMPDYIAVGSNEDFVRVPLSPIIAQAFARKYGLSLPTKTIVEETYQQAGRRVVGPYYSGPDEFEKNSAYLDSAGFYLRSNEDIQRQLTGVPPGTLVAGGKKELVVSRLVSVNFGGNKANESIDFYGLYGADGIPIQRTPGHGREAGYRHTEYALGVRFVSSMVVVRDGSGRKRVMKMDEALKDPAVAKILSRVERTEAQPNFRSPAMDGPFDPATAYTQGLPKGQKPPHGPDSA